MSHMLAHKMITLVFISNVSNVWISWASMRKTEQSLKICVHSSSPVMQNVHASSHQRGICNLFSQCKDKTVLNLKSGSLKTTAIERIIPRQGKEDILGIWVVRTYHSDSLQITPVMTKDGEHYSFLQEHRTC